MSPFLLACVCVRIHLELSFFGLREIESKKLAKTSEVAEFSVKGRAGRRLKN